MPAGTSTHAVRSTNTSQTRRIAALLPRKIRGWLPSSLVRNRLMLRRVLALAVGSGILAFASPAAAQVHWDAGAQVGVMKRFLGGDASKDAGFGPFGQIEGHV